MFNLDSAAVDAAADRLARFDVDTVCVGHGEVVTAAPLRAWRAGRSVR
ncbi:hypothetical protein ABZV91_24295 [Nocardia sp. NPDC004568]